MGNATLTGVTISDPKLGALVCVPPQPVTLAPGAQLVCTGSYTLRQADLNSGAVNNAATADSDQTPPTQTPSTVPLPVPSLSLAKSGTLDSTVVAPANRADAGDKVHYTLTATNAGNVTLTGVTIVDPKLGALVLHAAGLRWRRGLSCVCTGSYALTQADLDGGQVANTTTGDSDQTSPGRHYRDGAAAAGAGADAGQARCARPDRGGAHQPGRRRRQGQLPLTATNAGNVTLSGVTVSDPKLGALGATRRNRRR